MDVDYKMLNATIKKCGVLWCDKADDTLVEKLQKDLNVQLPLSYKKFLKEFGEGGIPGFYINGIDGETYSAAYSETEKYRKSENINKKWLVLSYVRTDFDEYLVCLNTENFINSECKVIKYDLKSKTKSNYFNEFNEYFNYCVEEEYNS